MRQNNSQAWFAQKLQDRATTGAQWVKLGHVRVKTARLANHCFICSSYLLRNNLNRALLTGFLNPSCMSLRENLSCESAHL